MSKSKEALALLDDLDSFTAAPAPPPAATGSQRVKKKTSSLTANPTKSSTPPPAAVNEKDAADALAFIDEITQKSAEPRRSMQSLAPGGTTTRVTLSGGSSRPGTPSTRKSTDSSRPSKVPTSAPAPEPAAAASGGGGWGWGGSIWSTASAALAQAREKVDEQVKNMPQIPLQMPPNASADQVRKWGEGAMEGAMTYVKQAQLEKLAQDLKTTGLTTLTGIMNAVAPPIAEHEVIQVALSHDMIGYDGVETLVYRSLARVLEQVEGGDLVVNRGNESRAKEGSGPSRELNVVDGLKAALKLAEVDVAEQIKVNANQPKKEATSSNPTTYTPVYLRIQPFTSTFPASSSSTEPKTLLQFLLFLTDPEHEITLTTVSQTVPYSWIRLWDLDEEEGNKKKNGEWIEDMLVEALRVSVEMVGQEYVCSRMSWDAALEEEDDDDDDDDEDESDEDDEEGDQQQHPPQRAP